MIIPPYTDTQGNLKIISSSLEDGDPLEPLRFFLTTQPG